MNMRIKEFCNGTVRDFAMALRARKVSGAFEKQAPEPVWAVSVQEKFETELCGKAPTKEKHREFTKQNLRNT